jgi:hypothetical protein
VPRELARIVRRALSKDLDRRYQTAKDLRNDLDELEGVLDSGELLMPVTASQSLPVQAGGAAARRREPAIVIAAILATAVVSVAGMYLFMSRAQSAHSATATALQDLQIIQLTTSGNATRPVISPDGKYVAYVQQSQLQDDQSRPGFAICNLPVCSSARFLPPNPNGQRIKWTPDGSGLLYLNLADRPQNLWIEPLDGTPPRQLTHFTDDRQIADAAFSRDGKRLAIARTTTTRDIVLFKGLKP